MFDKIKTAALIISSLIGAGMAWGTLSSRVSAVEELKPKVAQHETSIAEFKTDLKYMKEAIDRIEDKLGSKKK